MPIKNIIAGGVSILGVLAVAGTANANCFPPQNCNPAPVVHNSYTPSFDAVSIRNTEPLGHLRSVNFQRSPNVSITRVHGLGPNVALNDAPSSFTNDGCHPSSTVYCRAGNGAAAPIAQAPVVQAPVFVAPAPIVQQAPVYTAPAPVLSINRPLRTWVGKGYDPSKFIPRQYGENTFTPGIAHIPTSIVDRSPERADQVLNSGRTVAQPIVNGGVAPRSETYHIAQGAPAGAQFVQGPLIAGPVLSGPVLSGGLPALQPTGPAPVLNAPSFNVPINSVQFSQPNFVQQPVLNQGYRPAGRPVRTANGTYAAPVGSDGTYWEKTSGLTTIGGHVATEVLCKRTLPSQVVNPVIGVPTPVCTTPGHGPHAAHGPLQGPANFGAAVPSNPWTF